MGKARPQREMGYGFGTADLAEADQMDSKILNPVEQAVPGPLDARMRRQLSTAGQGVTGRSRSCLVGARARRGRRPRRG